MAQTIRKTRPGQAIRTEMNGRYRHKGKNSIVQQQDSATKNSNLRFDDVVSLAEVKDLARRLPHDSRARELMFALNDNETRWIALGQLLLIHKFLWNEFKR